MKKSIVNKFILNTLIIIGLFSFLIILLLGHYNSKLAEIEMAHVANVIQYSNITEKNIVNNMENLSVLLYDDNLNLKKNYGETINVKIEDIEKSKNNINEIITLNDKSPYSKILGAKSSEGLAIITYNGSFFNNIDRLIYNYLIITLLSVLVISIIVASILANRIVKPIEEVNKVTAKIASGENFNIVKVNTDFELQSIVDNFNKMSDRLETTIVDSLDKQNQFESMLTSMNSGVIALDREDRILTFNTYAKSLFGVYKEFNGEDIKEVLKNHNVNNLINITETPQEMQIQKADLRTIRYRTSNLLGNNDENSGKVIVIEDITDIKKLESLRSQFVANVSHELKTPLTSIKGYSETLRDVEDLDIKNKFLDIIDAESDRLQRLIEDILSLSSIENNEEVYFEIVDSVEVAMDVCRLLEKQANDKMVELSLTSKGKPLFIGDNDRFKQMVINLVDNAIKYTPNGGKVKVRIDSDNKTITMKISDNGVGIPESHLPRLFERFYRVSKSRDRAKGGTGLGLAIVKHIVMAFNGTIEVDSTLGKGTTFIVKLPRYMDDNENDLNDINTYVSSKQNSI